MRTIFSLAFALALLSCTKVDDFGKFTVGNGSNDMGGGGCTPGCDCIPADPTVGVPAHCRVAPLGAYDCLTSVRAGADVSVAAGDYTLDSGASPPTLTDGSGNLVMSGAVSGQTALFCVGSITLAEGVRVTLTGPRPVAIVADSLIHQANGSWSLGGNYATDGNGAAGVAGGTNGGNSASDGDGASAGKGGSSGATSSGPGTGGSGAGNVSAGGAGGSAMGGAPSVGGTVAAMPLAGFGGGGGGKGTNFGGGGGGGGGVLQLSASFLLELDAVIINGTGGGGAGGGANGTGGTGVGGGGGGGGSGGLLILDAPTVTLSNGCLAVIGGPGGAGGAATRGGDAHGAALCPFTGTAGVAPPSAGAGGVPGGNMPTGGDGTAGGGGGGGVGGYGRVVIRSSSPPSAPNVNPAMAYVPMTM